MLKPITGVILGLALLLAAPASAEIMTTERAKEVLTQIGKARADAASRQDHLLAGQIDTEQASSEYKAFVQMLDELPVQQGARHLFLTPDQGQFEHWLAEVDFFTLGGAIAGLRNDDENEAGRLDSRLQTVLRDTTHLETRLPPEFVLRPSADRNFDAEPPTLAEAFFVSIMLRLSPSGRGEVIEAALLGEDFTHLAGPVRELFVEGSAAHMPFNIPQSRLLALTERDPDTWAELLVRNRAPGSGVLSGEHLRRLPETAQLRYLLREPELVTAEDVVRLGEWALETDEAVRPSFAWRLVSLARQLRDEAVFDWLNANLAQIPNWQAHGSIGFHRLPLADGAGQPGLAPDLVAEMIKRSQQIGRDGRDLLLLQRLAPERATRLVADLLDKAEAGEGNIGACQGAALYAYDQVTGKRFDIGPSILTDRLIVGNRVLRQPCYEVIARWAGEFQSESLMHWLLDDISLRDADFDYAAEEVLDELRRFSLYPLALERLQSDSRWESLDEQFRSRHAALESWLLQQR